MNTCTYCRQENPQLILDDPSLKIQIVKNPELAVISIRKEGVDRPMEIPIKACPKCGTVFGAEGGSYERHQ